MIDPDFASFQVFVQPDQTDVILDKSSWPSWMIIRPWEKRGRKSGESKRIRNVTRDSGAKKIETVIGVHASRPTTPYSYRRCAPAESGLVRDTDHTGSIYCTPVNWYDRYDNGSDGYQDGC